MVYANAITRTERETGQDIEREIPYMKGYAVLNVEQIEGLPQIYHAKVAPTLDPVVRIDMPRSFSPTWSNHQTRWNPRLLC